ncbi:MAG: hypothetical protein ABW184_16310 [Sphingobium sp.]
MNRWFLPILLLTGCHGDANRFEVDAPDAISAQLQLCGQRIGLVRNGRSFIMSTAARCEGQGVIVVRFPRGRVAICAIDHVEPGVARRFAFAISGDECMPVGILNPRRSP